MNFFNNFFRGNEDGFKFQLFGPVHLAILTLFFLGVFFVITKLENNKKTEKYIKCLAIILLIDQIVLYAWQIGSGYFKIYMSFPLYHCRLVIWFLIYCAFYKNRTMKSITIFYSLLGAVMALIIPDLYKFSFPHYTNFQFFLVHLSMGWLVFYYLFVEKFKLNKGDLKNTLIVTNIFNVFLLIINFSLRPMYPNVNYGYILALPGNFSVFNSPAIHSAIMMVVFNFGLILIYKITHILQRRI